MKCLLPLLFVACSTRSTPDVVPVPATPAVAPPLTAAHGAAIELLAITDDGRAVVSQDSSGGTRLWPTLDGKREPIVLQMAIAKELAIARDARGFLIAARDEVGGAELVRVTKAGAVISRARIAPEPAIEAIEIAPQGVLALRADQTLAIFSATGELSARLAAEPGTRMKHVLSRNGHTLVLSSHGDEMRGRWLAGRQWGTETPALMVDPDSVAMLSPSGRRIVIDFERATYVLDTNNGGVVQSYSGTTPCGFTTDETVLYVKDAQLVWQPIGGLYGSARAEPEQRATLTFAVADGIAVEPIAGSLGIHTRAGVGNLGYSISHSSAIKVRGDHVVLMAPGEQAIVIDRELATTRVLDIDDDRMLTDVAPLDDHHVLATYTFRGGGGCCTASVIDLARHETVQEIQHPQYGGEIRYQPATGLLGFSDYLTSYLVAWNPTSKRFDTWFTLAGASASIDVLDPQLTDGVAAIALRTVNGKLEIAEIEREDLKTGARIEPRHHYFVAGSVVDVDARGTVYVSDHGTVIAYRHGVEVMRMTDRGGKLRAHPRGTYIAVLVDGKLALSDATGASRWEVVAPLAQEIAWLGDELLVQYAGGVGKIDAATGALIKRTCGWSFGLRALSTNDLVAGESICDAP